MKPDRSYIGQQWMLIETGRFEIPPSKGGLKDRKGAKLCENQKVLEILVRLFRT